MMRNYLLLIFSLLITGSLWAQTSHNVEVTSNQYTPEDLTISVGDTVIWENVQGSHNVDGRQATYPDNPESFYSGPASTGWTFSHVFTEEGFYDYECTPHVALGMVGTITVEPAQSNTADLQIVHNSPSPTVDIWVNDEPFVTDVEYRTATAYTEVPAGVNLNVGIALAGSSSPDDIIVDFDFTLEAGENYQIIANGIVGDTLTPFNLEVITPARQEADSSGVDFTIFHGSTDAPAVDVFARDVAQLADGLVFAENTDYINVPADDYIIDIKAAGTEPIVASFSAPLSGLEGGAATVLASGFLSPGPDDPAFGLFAVLADGTFLELESVTNVADLQIIHNSPSPTVDIWVNDEPFLTDVEYRTATSYVEVPAGVNLNVGIALAGSSSPDDILVDFDFLLDPDESYQVIANGIVGDMDNPFNLEVIAPARQEADSSGVDFTIFHGSTDAPAVDVFARGVAQLADGLAFAENTDYINVPADDYTIDIKAAGTEPIVASFSAPLSGLEGGAATVLASGFLSPGPDDPAFGLFAVLADGTFLELESVTNVADLQIIHNSPSPTVDIWVNDEPFLTDVEYRTATPFVEVPAGVNLNVGIALAGSSSPDDIVVDFDFLLNPDESYQVIANGIVGDMDNPFNLEVIAPARQEAEEDGVDFTIFHGSIDAPAVDVFARGVAQLADGLAFAENTDYINVPAADYTIDIKAAGTEPIVASFTAPLSGLEGGAATVIASGFLDPGADDPAFGLFAVLADGTFLEFESVTNVANLQIVHNSPSPTVDIWVNDEPFLTDVEYRTATPFVEVPAGVNLNVGIALAGSSSPDDIVVDFDFLLDPDENYLVVANGIVGDAQTPFNLDVVAPARLSAETDGVDFVIVHGSTDAPGVDVEARNVTTLVENLAFGESTEYINVPAANYTVDVRPAGSDIIVGSFLAPLTPLNGGAAAVVASGFLNPPTSDDPEFALLAVLPDGNVLALPQIANTARLQVVHNSPSPTVDLWVNDEPFITDFEFRTAREYVDVPAGANLNVGVALAGSTSPDDILVDFDFVLAPDETYQIIANGIVGDMDAPFNLEVVAPAREAAEAGGVDFVIFHGSPDAPGVDVFARDVAQLADNLSFTEQTDYINVPADDYTIDIAPAGSSDILVSYTAPLSGLEGGAATVMASGFLNPEMDDPAFGLFAVLPDGTVIELPVVTSAEQAIKGDIVIFPNPTTDRAVLNVDLEGENLSSVDVSIRDMNGRVVATPFNGELFAGRNTIDLPVSQLVKGFYAVEIATPAGVVTKKLVVQ